MDSCIEAFGTTKQKRALNSRRANRVGSDSLNHAVAKAAESIIDKKGVDGKQVALGPSHTASPELPSSCPPVPGRTGVKAALFLLLGEGLLRARLGNSEGTSNMALLSGSWSSTGWQASG